MNIKITQTFTSTNRIFYTHKISRYQQVHTFTFFLVHLCNDKKGSLLTRDKDNSLLWPLLSYFWNLQPSVSGGDQRMGEYSHVTTLPRARNQPTMTSRPFSDAPSSTSPWCMWTDACRHWPAAPGLPYSAIIQTKDGQCPPSR